MSDVDAEKEAEKEAGKDTFGVWEIFVVGAIVSVLAYYDLNFIEYIGVIVGGALVGNIIGEIWKKAGK